MSEANSNVTASSLLAITSATAVFSALLPPLPDVRKAVKDPDMTDDVRLGELAAGVLVVAIGVTAMSLTGSAIPFAVSLMAATGLVCLYESVLSATPKGMIP